MVLMVSGFLVLGALAIIGFGFAFGFEPIMSCLFPYVFFCIIDAVGMAGAVISLAVCRRAEKKLSR